MLQSWDLLGALLLSRRVLSGTVMVGAWCLSDSVGGYSMEKLKFVSGVHSPTIQNVSAKPIERSEVVVTVRSESGECCLRLSC